MGGATYNCLEKIQNLSQLDNSFDKYKMRNVRKENQHIEKFRIDTSMWSNSTEDILRFKNLKRQLDENLKYVRSYGNKGAKRFLLLMSIRIQTLFMARKISIGQQMKLRNLKIKRAYGEGGMIKLSVFLQVILSDQVQLNMCVR